MSLNHNDQKSLANLCHDDLEMAWRVKAIIEKDYHKSQTVEDLATIVGTNKSTLNCLFHKITQMPVKQYMLWFRIEKAKDLLINTNYSIKQISSKVGISRRNFERQFKKLVNMTPYDWRKKGQYEPENTPEGMSDNHRKDLIAPN